MANPLRTARLIVWLPLILLAAALVGVVSCSLIGSLFGPPAVELTEAYGEGDPSVTVDHAKWDAVLAACVRGTRVDYEALRKSPDDLGVYLAQLARTELESLGRDEKLALLINAYNAFTLRLILDHFPLASIRDIPGSERWDARRWALGGLTLSLTEIENDYLRARFREPRIHFAINCASIGCPPLRGSAYTGAGIDAQLEEQARFMHRDARWFRLEPEAGPLHLTKLYDWYSGDFVQVAGSALDYAARFSPELVRRLESGTPPGIIWLDYDWALNATPAK